MSGAAIGLGTKSRQKRGERTAGKAERSPKVPKAGRALSLSDLIGRDPRIDLLPPEVHVGRRERARARRAWLGVVVVAVVVGLVVAAAALTAGHADDELTAAQERTTTLLAQQGKYGEVRSVERDTALLRAAQAVGGASEIDWGTYLTDLQAALPVGVTISDLSITSQDAVTPFAQSSSPVQGQRIATIQASVKSEAIPSVPEWTEALSGLKGLTDSAITSVAQDEDTGGYTGTITLHVDERAFDGKYLEAGTR